MPLPHRSWALYSRPKIVKQQLETKKNMDETNTVLNSAINTHQQWTFPAAIWHSWEHSNGRLRDRNRPLHRWHSGQEVALDGRPLSRMHESGISPIPLWLCVCRTRPTMRISSIKSTLPVHKRNRHSTFCMSAMSSNKPLTIPTPHPPCFSF